MCDAYSCSHLYLPTTPVSDSPPHKSLSHNTNPFNFVTYHRPYNSSQIHLTLSTYATSHAFFFPQTYWVELLYWVWSYFLEWRKSTRSHIFKGNWYSYYSSCQWPIFLCPYHWLPCSHFVWLEFVKLLNMLLSLLKDHMCNSPIGSENTIKL